jgi:hypothetical protein
MRSTKELDDYSLNLSETVDHERDELNAAEPRNLVLGLEPLEQEPEELRDEPRRRSVVLVVLVDLTVCYRLLPRFRV